MLSSYAFMVQFLHLNLWPTCSLFDVKERGMDPHLIVFQMASHFPNTIYWVIHSPNQVMPALSYSKFLPIGESISGLFILFYWSFYLFLYVCQIVLFTPGLSCIFFLLRFFFLEICWTFFTHIFSQMNFSLILSI